MKNYLEQLMIDDNLEFNHIYLMKNNEGRYTKDSEFKFMIDDDFQFSSGDIETLDCWESDDSALNMDRLELLMIGWLKEEGFYIEESKDDN